MTCLTCNAKTPETSVLCATCGVRLPLRRPIVELVPPSVRDRVLDDLDNSVHELPVLWDLPEFAQRYAPRAAIAKPIDAQWSKIENTSSETLLSRISQLWTKLLPERLGRGIRAGRRAVGASGYTRGRGIAKRGSIPGGKLGADSEERLCLLRGEVGIHRGRRKNSQSESSTIRRPIFSAPPAATISHPIFSLKEPRNNTTGIGRYPAKSIDRSPRILEIGIRQHGSSRVEGVRIVEKDRQSSQQLGETTTAGSRTATENTDYYAV